MKSFPEWKLLDHTADVRIEVRGETLEKLFVNAALALTYLLSGRRKGFVANIEKNIILESDSLDVLLADWLREILFYFSAENFLLCDASLNIEGVHLLRARLSGHISQVADESYDGMEIKGVTYHGLSLEKKHEGYVAHVIFDA
ncbi:MAG: archease [Deltaproteobacteria bacterium]|nr:archease [Deltaproteobacteria bacterium]